jgi:hypothetical protein
MFHWLQETNKKWRKWSLKFHDSRSILMITLLQYFWLPTSSVRLLSTRKMQQNTNEAQTQAQTEERHIDR